MCIFLKGFKLCSVDLDYHGCSKLSSAGLCRAAKLNLAKVHEPMLGV